MLKAGVAKCQECQKSKNTTNISYLLYAKSYNISNQIFTKVCLCFYVVMSDAIYIYVFAILKWYVP